MLFLRKRFQIDYLLKPKKFCIFLKIISNFNTKSVNFVEQNIPWKTFALWKINLHFILT